MDDTTLDRRILAYLQRNGRAVAAITREKRAEVCDRSRRFGAPVTDPAVKTGRANVVQRATKEYEPLDLGVDPSDTTD